MKQLIEVIGQVDIDDKLKIMLADFLEELSDDDLAEVYAGGREGMVQLMLDEDEDEEYSEDELMKLDSGDLIEMYYGRGDLIWDLAKDTVKDNRNPSSAVYKLMREFDKSLTKKKFNQMLAEVEVEQPEFEEEDWDEEDED